MAAKPGRPFVLGRWGAKLVFGLPGNPVSALVTFVSLARPAPLRSQGAKQVALPSHPGVLAEPLDNPDARPHFLHVTVDETGQVRSASRQAAPVLRSLAAADGLVEVSARTTLAAGNPVPVLRWAKLAA